ncbi:translation initiation factor eIF2B subunit gamma [Centruroides vittatus]|uniref:translation initiation factor eIF2B subunit gamma n=1 Tax=Centruroides vittatus TaxID=120091 RepID=UPI00350F29CF
MEFQAVVMAAGRGSRMTEITSGCPKYLLPVGNLPLVFYPLYTLQQAGFQEAIVVVPETVKTKSLVDMLSGRLDMKLDIVSIPSQEEWGTADSLRFIKSKIKTDIIVITCDLVTDFPLCELADIFRAHDASLAILLSDVPSLKDASIPGYKGKHCEEKDIIGINNCNGKLVLLNSEADFEEEIPMKVSLLKRNPIIHMYSNLMDGHVYIMKKWIVDYLSNNESISTLKGELLPLLVKKQKKIKSNKESNIQNMTSSVTSFNVEKDIYSYVKEDRIKDLISKLSDKCDMEDKTQISCYAHIAKSSLFMRVNTLAAYAEINRQISRHLSSISNKLNLSKSLITAHQYKSNISNDSIIGDHTIVAEKASIKKSVVGPNCQLKEKVKIINSVIMDHVTIEEGSHIQGSIICSNTHLGKQCEIKDSIIGRGQNVADSCKLSHQVLQDVDRLLEI